MLVSSVQATLRRDGYNRASTRQGARSRRRSFMELEQTVFMICMFLGVASVALIAFTLLAIVLGKVKV